MKKSINPFQDNIGTNYYDNKKVSLKKVNYEDFINSSNIKFKKAFFINLERRIDRKEEFLGKKPKNLDVELFKAVDAKNIIEEMKNTVDVLEKKLPILLNDKNQCHGMVGCWLSHIRLWNKIAYSDEFKNNDYFIIFEDDTFFVDFWEHQFFSRMMELANYYFDYINIGGRFDKDYNIDESAIIGNENYKKITNHFYQFKGEDLDSRFHRTTQAYILSKKGAKNILTLCNDWFQKGKDFVPIDHWINSNRHHLESFDTLPHLCWVPIGYKSDIQNDSERYYIPINNKM
jgi:GR25 family glycosyltransferase involved in LPS biosynthesis